MIVINEGDYVLGIWFVSAPSGDDWMGCVIRPKGKNHFEGNYRFRYRKDDNIFDSDDEKSWYSFIVRIVEDEPLEQIENDIIGLMDDAAYLAAAGMGADELPWRGIVRGTYKEFEKVVKDAPFFNTKTVPVEEL